MTTETNVTGTDVGDRTHTTAELHAIPRPRRARRTAGRAPEDLQWRTSYRRMVIASDLVAVAAASASSLLWGTAQLPEVAVIGTAMVLLSAASLPLAGAWDATMLGQGSREYTGLARGLIGLAIAVGLISLALQLPQGRPWAFGVLPLAVAIASVLRRGLRIGLHRRRTRGEAMASVLAVGNADTVEALINRTRRSPHHGWTITGVCTPSGIGQNETPEVAGVPVLGDLDSVARLIHQFRFDTVSVGQTTGWSSTRLQQLAWDIESTSTELVVDPGLMEIAGPRLHVTNVDGLPLLRLTRPSFSGYPQLVKGVIDRVAAALLLFLMLPLFVVVGIAVVSDGGPVFFRQTRVGLDGREFRMVKFRSMVVDAEAALAALQAANEAAGPLFKMRGDPRITQVGRLLRKYSLDEVPQLLNVLGGSMSLVGPRPPLPREVADYERDARRRLLVKPGMTGLWQISGRSDLSWEETVRLDLRYVENWTLVLDLQIVLRTVRAVLRSAGAY